MGGAFEDAGQRTHLYRPSCLGQIRSRRSSHRCNLLAREHNGRFRTRSECRILLLGDPQSSHRDLRNREDIEKENKLLGCCYQLKPCSLSFFRFYRRSEVFKLAGFLMARDFLKRTKPFHLAEGKSI